MIPSINNDHVKSKLQPVVDAIKGIDAEAIMFDPEIFEIAAGLMLWAEGTIEALDRKPVTAETDTQGSDLKALVARVSLRILSLNVAIERENRLGLEVVESHERQVEDLKFGGCSTKEIEELAPYPFDKVEAFQLNIIDLKAQQNTLEAFIQSGPEYDFSWLADTEFAVETQES